MSGLIAVNSHFGISFLILKHNEMQFSIRLLGICLGVLLHLVVLGQHSKAFFQTPTGRWVDTQAFDQHIQEAMRLAQVPGLSIAIINHKEVVYQGAFGVINTETQAPVEYQTIFEAASLSKPIFAYFVMKMVEKGVIDLDEPLHSYLPYPYVKDNDERVQLITARMVLSHSAGFPNWANGEMVELKYTPGTGFSYSGEAYQYLAALIGQEKGVGWKEELNEIFIEEVAKPLGLTNSSFAWNEGIAKHKAFGHKEGKPTDNGTGGWNGKTFGAGYSLHSNATDYAKFLVAMLQEEGLKPASFDSMKAEQNPIPTGHELLATGQTGWGLGFARRPTENGLRYLHTGNNHDFQSFCSFNPENGFGIVFFINCEKGEDFLDHLGKFLDYKM